MKHPFHSNTAVHGHKTACMLFESGKLPENPFVVFWQAADGQEFDENPDIDQLLIVIERAANEPGSTLQGVGHLFPPYSESSGTAQQLVDSAVKLWATIKAAKN